ncbi:MAG: hybrid sensor histidine kinase/response regulator [Polyangiaceae bacterium]|nr:hybrid sensor histidine kinase/response regulator [Polyangiaceae bacterium]
MSTQPEVLVVDDDARGRAVVLGYLRSKYRVHEAESGPAALAFLERQLVDVVLLDVMMPGMSGFDVCREVKRRYVEPYLPVLLLTALSDQDDRNTGLAAGADDFLVKPVDRRELELRVAAFVRLRRQDEAIRAQLAEIARVSASRDELVGLLAHDVGNALNSVQLNLRVLGKRLEAAGVAGVGPALERASASTKAASERVADVLQVRLLEDGARQLRREPIVLRDLVAGLVERLAAVAEESHVSLVAEVECCQPISVDGRLITRAIENLVVNAIHHSPEGGTVRVRGAPTPEGCELEVIDQGPGVPDAVKEEVFVKFKTADRSGRGRKGYGLGLYMVRATAELHEGSVEVLDAPGGGASFRLRLPGARGPAASPS